MWIIQSPISFLFPAPFLVLERDLSCSTYLSYRPVSSLIQLYLYRLLAATVGNVPVSHELDKCVLKGTISLAVIDIT